MKAMSAEEFDRKFDNGEDISEYIDRSTMRRPGLENSKRVNLDLPVWILNELDRESHRLGVTRQSLIKVWIGAKLDALRAERGATAAPAKNPSPQEAA